MKGPSCLQGEKPDPHLLKLQGPKADLDVEGPTADVDISSPKVSGDAKLKVKKPKLKGPSCLQGEKPDPHLLKLQGPKVDLDVEGPKVDASIKTKKPKLKGPKCLKGEPEADIALVGPGVFVPEAPEGKATIDLPTADVQVSKTEVAIKAPKIEIEKPSANLDFNLPDFPSFGMKGKVDVPDVDIKGPSADIDVNADADVELHKPTIQHATNIDFSLPNVSLPEIKGPKVEVEKPKGKFDFQLPEVKMPSANFDISMPSFKMEGKKPDVDVVSPDIDVNAPKAELSLPKVEGELDFHLPALDVDKPELDVKVPDVSIRTKKPKAKGLSCVGDANNEAPDPYLLRLQGPKADITGPNAKVDVKKPGMKGPKCLKGEAEVDVPTAGLQVEGPGFDVSQGGNIQVDVSVPKSDANMSAPSVQMKKPKFKGPSCLSGEKPDPHLLKLQGPKVDIDVNKPKADASIKKPKIKGPSCFRGEADIDVPEAEFDVKTPDAKATADIDLDTSTPKADIDIAAPSVQVKTKKPKFKGPSCLKGEKPDPHLLKLQGPKVDMPAVAIDTKTPDASGNIALDVSIPKAETDIAAPTMQVKSKKPKFKGPSCLQGEKPDPHLLKLQGPKLDVDVDKPKADVSVKKTKLKGPSCFRGEVDIDEPNADLDAHIKPAVAVNVETPKIESTADINLDVSTPKADIDVAAPDMRVKAKKPKFKGPSCLQGEKPDPHLLKLQGPKVDVDVEKPKADVSVKRPKLKGPSCLRGEADIDLPKGELDVKAEPIAIDVKTPDTGASADINLDVSTPKANIDVASPSMEVKVKKPKFKGPSCLQGEKPDLHLLKLQGPKVDVEKPKADVSVKRPKLKGPSCLRGEADIDLPKGQLDVKTEPITIDVKTPDTGASADIDLDVSTPKSDIDVTSPSVQVKAKKPKFKGPSCLKGEKPDPHLLKLQGPKLDVDVDKPKADISVKKPKVRGPSCFRGEAEIEPPKVDLDTEIKPALAIDVKTPNTDASADVNLDVSTPKADVDVAAPGVKVKTKKPKFKGPSCFQGEKPDPHLLKLQGPKVDVDINEPKADVSIKKPKLKGPSCFRGEADIDVPKAELEVEVAPAAIDVKIPDTEATADVDLDVSTPKPVVAIDVETPKLQAAPELKAKKPKFKGPACLSGEKPDPYLLKLQGPKTDIDVTSPKADINVKKPKVKGPSCFRGEADIDLPNADLDARVEPVAIEVETPTVQTVNMSTTKPEVNIAAPNVEIKAKKPKFRGPSCLQGEPADPHLLKLQGPKANIDLEKPKADVSVKKPKVKGPSCFRGEADIDIPKTEVKVETPALDIGGGVKVETPAVDIGGDVKAQASTPSVDVTTPNADVKKPKFKGLSCFQVEKADPYLLKLQGPEVDVNKPNIDPNIKAKKPKIKGPKCFQGEAKIEAPQADIEAVGPGVSIPEVPEVTLQTPKAEMDLKKPDAHFKGPEIEIQKPSADFDFSLPNIKMPSIGLKGKVEGPDVDVGGPSVDIDGPSVDIAGKSVEADIEVPKPTIQKSGDIDFSLPDFKSPKLELEKPKGQFDFQLPEVKLPSANFGMSMPSLKADKPDIDLELKTAEIEVPKLETEMPHVDLEVKEPKLELPKLEADVRADFKTPEAEIDIPKVDIAPAEVKVKKPRFKGPSCLKGEAPDPHLLKLHGPKTIDGKGPKADMTLGSVNLELEGPKTDMQVNAKKPKFSGPSCFKGESPDPHLLKLQGPKADLEIETPKADASVKKPKIKGPSCLKGDADLPKADPYLLRLQGPKLDTSGDIPKADLPETEVGGSVKVKTKKPTLKRPSCLKGDTEADLKGPDASLSVGTPSTDMEVTAKRPKLRPSCFKGESDIDVKTPTINMSSPQVEIESPKADIDIAAKLPELNVSKPSLKGPKIEGPDAQFDISMGKPSIDLNGAEVFSPELSIDMPELEISGPKADLNVSGPSVQTKVEVPSGELEVKVPVVDLEKGGNFDLHMPKISADVPTLEIDVKKPSGGFDISKPNLHLPNFKVNGPNVDLDTSAPDLEVNGKVIDIETPTLDAEIPHGSIDVETPTVEVEFQKPSATFDLNMPNISLPKLSFQGKKPEAEIDVESPEVDIDIKSSKPSADISVEVPSAEVDLDVSSPSVEIEKPSGKLDLHMPEFSLPKFGFKGKGAKLESPEVETGLDVPVSDVQLPAGEIEVTSPSTKGSFHLPKFGLKGKKQKPESPDADLNLKVDGELPDVDLESPNVTTKGKSPKSQTCWKGLDSPDPYLLRLQGPKANVSGNVDVTSPDVDTKSKGGSLKFKVPSFKGPNFNRKSKTLPVVNGELDTDASIIMPEGDLSNASFAVDANVSQDAKLEVPEGNASINVEPPKGSLKVKKSKGPSCLKGDGDLDVKGPLVNGDTTDVAASGAGSLKKSESFKFKMPHIKAPDFHIKSASPKIDQPVVNGDLDADVTIENGEIDAEVPKGLFKAKLPGFKGDTSTPEVDKSKESKDGSLKFRMPRFHMKSPNADVGSLEFGTPKASAHAELSPVLGPEGRTTFAIIESPDIDFVAPKLQVTPKLQKANLQLNTDMDEDVIADTSAVSLEAEIPSPTLESSPPSKGFRFRGFHMKKKTKGKLEVDGDAAPGDESSKSHMKRSQFKMPKMNITNRKKQSYSLPAFPDVDVQFPYIDSSEPQVEVEASTPPPHLTLQSLRRIGSCEEQDLLSNEVDNGSKTLPTSRRGQREGVTTSWPKIRSSGGSLGDDVDSAGASPDSTLKPRSPSLHGSNVSIKYYFVDTPFSATEIEIPDISSDPHSQLKLTETSSGIIVMETTTTSSSLQCGDSSAFDEDTSFAADSSPIEPHNPFQADPSQLPLDDGEGPPSTTPSPCSTLPAGMNQQHAAAAASGALQTSQTLNEHTFAKVSLATKESSSSATMLGDTEPVKTSSTTSRTVEVSGPEADELLDSIKKELQWSQ